MDRILLLMCVNTVEMVLCNKYFLVGIMKIRDLHFIRHVFAPFNWLGISLSSPSSQQKIVHDFDQVWIRQHHFKLGGFVVRDCFIQY